MELNLSGLVTFIYLSLFSGASLILAIIFGILAKIRRKPNRFLQYSFAALMTCFMGVIVLLIINQLSSLEILIRLNGGWVFAILVILSLFGLLVAKKYS